MFATLAGLFDSVVQYNADNRGFEHPTVPPPPNIMSVCAAINAKNHHHEVSAVADYKAAISLMKAEFQPSPECLDVSYSEMVENMRNDTLGGPGEAMDRQWVWQTCTEFGYRQARVVPSNVSDLCVSDAHLEMTGICRTPYLSFHGDLEVYPPPEQILSVQRWWRKHAALRQLVPD